LKKLLQVEKEARKPNTSYTGKTIPRRRALGKMKTIF
jgi:hypothetical protein